MIPSQVTETSTKTCLGALSNWTYVKTEYNGSADLIYVLFRSQAEIRTHNR